MCAAWFLPALGDEFELLVIKFRNFPSCRGEKVIFSRSGKPVEPSKPKHKLIHKEEQP